MRQFLEAVEDHLCAVVVVGIVVCSIIGALVGRRG